jgi:hypothetical protein
MHPTRTEKARAEVKKAATPTPLQRKAQQVAEWLVSQGVGADLPEDVRTLTFKTLNYVPPGEWSQLPQPWLFWLWCLEASELFEVGERLVWRCPRPYHGTQIGELKVHEVSLVDKPADPRAVIALIK